MRALVAVAAILAVSGPFLAAASSGDQSRAFRACVESCQATGCAVLGGVGDEREQRASAGRCSPLCTGGEGSGKPQLWLTTFLWTCRSDCEYRCVWAVEDLKAGDGRAAPVEKYFGKWPFLRAMGMQEPASVAFSILNLAANLWAARAVAAKLNSGAFSSSSSSFKARVYPSLWLAHFLLACNVWLWSAVFHCRDTKATERLDYFSAGALVAFNLLVSITRVVGVASGAAMVAIGAPIFGLYAVHVHHMLAVLFDYGLHVGLCVGAGAIQTGAWAAWAVGSKEGRAHPGRRALLGFMAAVNVAMLLEVLDFPPIWKVFDAHALWHAATAPLTVLWYKFVAQDVEALVLSLEKGGGGGGKQGGGRKGN